MIRTHSTARVASLLSRGRSLGFLGLEADAFILKTESASAFAAVLAFVLAGNRYVSPELAADAEAEVRWRRELIERTPAAILILQDDRRAYMNPAYASRAATLVPGCLPELLEEAPIWEAVEEGLRECVRLYSSSWFEQRPMASRIKVALRRRRS